MSPGLMTLHFGQHEARNSLKAHIFGGQRVIQLIGRAGSGKTTLLTKIGLELAEEFGARMHWLSAGSPAMALHDLRKLQGESRDGDVVVLDSGDSFDDHFLEEFSAESLRYEFTSLIITFRGARRFRAPRVVIPPMTTGELALLLSAFLGGHRVECVPDLLQFSQESPQLALELARLLEQGADLNEIKGLITPFKASGILGPDGRPIDAEGKIGERIISQASIIERSIFENVCKDPGIVFDLSPRKFEELVAEIFHRKGYTVELTPQTRDGGVDIYAVKKEDLGTFLCIVECKRYAPDRPVSVDVVRGLYGVTHIERANAGVIVTTSRFTSDAIKLVQELRYQMSLKDYLDLQRLLASFSKR